MPAAEWDALERWMFRADIPRGFGPQTPPLLQQVSAWLPLTHAVELARPLVRGDIPAHWAFHTLALLVWGFAGFWLALGLTRRRLLK